MNIGTILFKRKESNEIALKTAKSSITYKELFDKSKCASGGLKGSSQIVGIYMDNSIDFLIGFWSIIFANKTALLINSGLKSNEVEELCRLCSVDTIYVDRKFDCTISLSQIVLSEIDVCCGDEICLDDNGDEIALIIPTSGTTSNSKLVQLSHRNLFCGIEHTLIVSRKDKYSRDIVTLSLCSRTAMEGQVLSNLYVGALTYINEISFNPYAFFSCVNDEMITHTILVPAMVKLLIKYHNGELTDNEIFRTMSVVGEKLDSASMEEFYRQFPNIVMCYGYGMTEMGTVAFNTEKNDKALNSVGKVNLLPSVVVKIVDDNENELERNRQGEIVVTGENKMKQYYNFVSDDIKDGWFFTGDIGYIDDDDNLFITGRKKNMINCGGKKIFPEEVEVVINRYEGVSESLVKSEEHDMLGEIVVAKIVLEENASFDMEKFEDYCKLHLANFKIPKKVIICDMLEKTASHKIKRG